MAKRFSFDDDDDFFDDDISSNSNTNHNNEIDSYDFEEPKGKSMTKKTKNNKKKIKPWQIVVGIILALFIALFVYVFVLTNTDGPVYGSRCEGITTINDDAKTSTVNTIKKKYSSVKNIDIEVVCKEVKIDIEFKDNMDKSSAKKIGEEAAKTLDENVGLEKSSGKTYSNLYGYIKNVAQYDVSLYLVSNDSDDFPIYATKHHSKDKFSYTYASVKDKDSKNKAESTLE